MNQPATPASRDPLLTTLLAPTRRERVTFAVQIVLGIGRMAITLYGRTRRLAELIRAARLRP